MANVIFCFFTTVVDIQGMGLYHPLDGITNLKYKLLYFLAPNEKNFKEKGTSY
jgi:hypothetical protein